VRSFLSGGFMLSILTFLFKIIFNLFQSKKNLLLTISLQQKEIEILKRKSRNKPLFISQIDRIILVVLNRIGKIKDSISIVKPETLLFWQRELIKKFWTFKSLNAPGRPPVSVEVKQLILSMKNNNLYWGNKKIQGELLKLGISLDKKTIRNIIDHYRRREKIKKSLGWKQFLSAQANSIYAMDFFTIDTILLQRYYIFFIIHHKSRAIAQFAITQNPTREFLRQQIIEFSDSLKNSAYIIHDNAAQFHLDFLNFELKNIRISVKAPNMNSIAERFVGSARREAFDFFLLISEKHIRGILIEYIDYYNALRPHQGINQNIPQGYKPQNSGKIRKIPILGGICYHYERGAA
jgi:transposase InsO family protein